MNRRQVLQLAASTIAVSLAGCAGDIEPTETASSPESAGDADGETCEGDTPTGGPQSPYDTLMLYQMPEYVTRYSETVIVKYSELGAAAQRAVQQALAIDGAYRECSRGPEQTGVMALFSSIERRWEQTDGSSFRHTYLQYEDDYYGITLVQEGDFIRIQSIPCTAEACPTTPTPPG